MSNNVGERQRITGNTESHTKRRTPRPIPELSVRQPVRLAASLARKRRVATSGHLLYASSAAQVISSTKNYRRGLVVVGRQQMRGESAWAASGETQTAVAGSAGPRFMVQSLQTAGRALCRSHCKPWAGRGVSGKHCFWYSHKYFQYSPRTVLLHLYNPTLKRLPWTQWKIWECSVECLVDVLTKDHAPSFSSQ